MLYEVFSAKIKDIAIEYNEESETWYLNPDWYELVHKEVLDDLSKLEDSYIEDWIDVEGILRLETERRNASNPVKTKVFNWLYDLISSTVEPMMIQEETEYIKNMREYMKTSHQINKEEPDNIVQFPNKDE